MTTKFAHRTSISFQELIAHGEISEQDLRDGILNQRLVPSYFIESEVSEFSIDADGELKRTKGAFKKELMFLVKPRAVGSLDCDFEFCAVTADAVETGAAIFQLGAPGGYVRPRISMTDILDKGVMMLSELQRFELLFRREPALELDNDLTGDAKWWNIEYDIWAMALSTEEAQKTKGWGVNQRGPRAGRYPLKTLSEAVSAKIATMEKESGKNRKIGFRSIQDFLKNKGWK